VADDLAERDPALAQLAAAAARSGSCAAVHAEPCAAATARRAVRAKGAVRGTLKEEEARGEESLPGCATRRPRETPRELGRKDADLGPNDARAGFRAPKRPKLGARNRPPRGCLPSRASGTPA
jgi:hypothetical protein